MILSFVAFLGCVEQQTGGFEKQQSVWTLDLYRLDDMLFAF